MRRAFMLLISLAFYAIFFATFLYLIGFVGAIPGVPKTVDSGTAGALLPAVAIDIALIALFGVQHSVMARKGFKAMWTKVVPAPLERSVYVLLASVVLMVMFAFWRPITGEAWRVDHPVAAGAIWAVFAAGWGIVLLSTFLINHFELFGLQQAFFHLRGKLAAAPKFRQPFFYKIVRHPLYSGFLLAFWAAPVMTWGHLLLAAGMSVYILIAIGHEERDLIDAFGQDYEDYRRRVGKLAPRIGRARS